MIFTRRFFLYLALGAIPLLLSGAFPLFALMGMVWNLVLLGICLVDYVRCPAPATAFSVERATASALSVATGNTVAIRIANLTGRPQTIQVRDEPPVEFEIAPETTRQWKVRIPVGEPALFEYTVTPPARGDFTFGDVYVRVTGPLGLIVRQGSVSAGAPVSVYPNLRAVEDYELMLRRAHVTKTGTRRIRIAGGGREFSSLREYTPDDEYRVIDWKATARRGKVIARTFETERSQDVLLLIDLGRLMRQEIANTQKLDYVVNAALMLSHVVAEADDRVGLLTFSAEPRKYLAPRRGRAQANDILQALYAARAEPVESDYRAAFRFLSARWRKRSLTVLFTDLADPESSAMLLAEIAQLAAMHLVVCVIVSDPLIAERAALVPETVDQVYQKAVADEVIIERRRALDLLQKRGVIVVDAEPRELSVELVARYLDVKSRALL